MQHGSNAFELISMENPDRLEKKCLAIPDYSLLISSKVSMQLHENQGTRLE